MTALIMDKQAILAITITTTMLACSGGQRTQEYPLSGPIEVDGTNLHLPPATVANSTVDSLREAVKTACDGPCERVFVPVGPGTSPVVLEKFTAAATGHAHQPYVHAVPPSGDLIDIVAPTDCRTKIFIEEDAGYVESDGSAARPDITCDRWDATVCRDADGRYDWPRLRTVVGDVEPVCVALADGTSGAELVSIFDVLRKPDMSVIDETRSASAAVSGDAVQKKVKAQRGDTDWCFRQVLEETKPSDVAARLAIDASGDVVRTEITGTRTTPQFERCIEEVLEKMEFAVSGAAAVTVTDVTIEWSER